MAEGKELTMADGNRNPLASSAIKAAAKDVENVKDGGEPALSDPGARGFKILLWLLIVVDLAAVGGYLWLKFGRNGEREAAIKQSESLLLRLKPKLVNLDETVRRIQRDQVQKVADPGTLLVSVAGGPNFRIADAIVADKPLTAPFGKSGYEETTSRFTFRNRSSYKFNEILSFFVAVEKANPSIQIKEINFGERLPGEGNNMWEVKQGVVRVLKPKSG